MSDASVAQARLVGALFVERGLLSPEQLERALELQAERGALLGEILVAEFGISRVELASVLAEQWAELEQAGDDIPQPEVGAADEPHDGADLDVEDGASRRRIGEIFVERGFVTENDILHALEAQKETGKPLGEVLIERGRLSRLDLASALAEQWSGLEKLRPPAPRPVEGWQQVAPVEHAAAMAQGASREGNGDTVDPGLAEAVAAFGHRLTAVEAHAASPEWLIEIRAACDGLSARLDAVESGLGDGATAAERQIDELRAALDELRSRIDGPVSRLGEVEDRVVALEHGRADAERVVARLDALEARPVDEWRQELGLVAEGMTTRVEGIDARLEEAAAGARRGLENVLGTLGSLEQRLSAIASAPPAQHEHEEIAALQERLDKATNAVERLAHRLTNAEHAGAGTASRTEIDELRSRLEELSGPPEQSGVDERLTAIESVLGERPWLERLHRLGDELGVRLDGMSGRLDEARQLGAQEIEGLRQSVAALASRVAEKEHAGAAIHDRERVDALEQRLAGAGAAVDDVADRVTALESLAAASPWQDEVRRLADDLGERLGRLSGRLDELVEADGEPAERAALEARLAEAIAEAERLASRVTALEGIDTANAWRDEVAELRARLDDAWTAGREAAHDQPWPDDVQRLAAELGGRVDALARRLDEVPASDRGRLESLQQAVDSLAERLEHEVRARVHARPGDDEMHALIARLDELSAWRTAVDGLGGRMSAIEARAQDEAWRDATSSLESRLAELDARLAEHARSTAELAAVGEAGASAADRTDLERLDAVVGEVRAAVDEAMRAAAAARAESGEAAASEASARERLAVDLGGRIDELATAVRADLDVVRGDLGTELGGRIDELAGVVRTDLGVVRADVGEVRAAVDEALRAAAAAGAQGGEAAASEASARERLAVELGGRIDELAGVVRAELGVVGARIDSLAAAADAAGERDLVAADDLRSAIEGSESRLHERLAAYDEAIVVLRRRLEEIAAADRVLGERIVGLEAGLADRVDETAAALSDESASWRDALDGLAARLVGVERQTWSTPEALDGIRGELAAIREHLSVVESAASETAGAGSGLADATAALASRLTALEQAMAAPDDAVERRLAKLERRFETETSRADERTRATERALRKGLATLGERLAESETSYTDAGNALRRSIERLGRAITETDARIASRDGQEPEADIAIGAFVAFAPTPDGYRLVPLDGSPPRLGDTMQLDGKELLVVTRVGVSPIPLDDRPCVYLEPVRPDASS